MTEKTEARVPWKAVLLFVVTAFALAWLLILPLWLTDGLASPLALPLTVLMMFTPLAATFIVNAVTGVPGRPLLRGIAWWPLRPAKRFVGMMVLALFAPIAIVAATFLIAALTGLVRIDVDDSVFAASLAGLPAASLPPLGVLIALQLAMIPFGAVVNSFAAVGEETGWRGWLLPALRPLGVWPALLLSGAIWGLWHAPVILLGYNFGRTDGIGVVLMVIGCMGWGVVIGWLRMRSASVWPAVLAHGSLNAAAGLGMLFAASDQVGDPGIVGPLGLIAAGVCVLIGVILTLTGQMRWAEPAAYVTRTHAAGGTD